MILQSPSSLLGLNHGLTGLMNSLGISWREKWAEHPVRVRHVHNFDIILNEHDEHARDAAGLLRGSEGDRRRRWLADRRSLGRFQ